MNGVDEADQGHGGAGEVADVDEAQHHVHRAEAPLAAEPRAGAASREEPRTVWPAASSSRVIQAPM